MTPEDRAREKLQRLIDDGGVPGIQYMVMDRQGVVFEFNGGMRDIGNREPVTAETTFMSSSTTKTITALAVLKLVEQGLVSLDDPLGKHFPDQPYGDGPTVRQLILHTAGVPNPMPIDWFHPVDAHDEYDESAALKRVLESQTRLKSKPGMKYRYSNLGYWLLSKVIENAAGTSYGEYVRENILEPLDISPDELGCTVPAPGNQAVGYIKRFSVMGVMMRFMAPDFVLGGSEGAWRSFKPVYMNGTSYGGLIGTARGWSRFLADQIEDSSKVMSPKTREQFYEHQHTSDGREIGMTLGWHTGSMGEHEHHSKVGGGPGFSCNIRLYRERGIASVWQMNRMESSESPCQKMSDAIDSFFLP